MQKLLTKDKDGSLIETRFPIEYNKIIMGGYDSIFYSVDKKSIKHDRRFELIIPDQKKHCMAINQRKDKKGGNEKVERVSPLFQVNDQFNLYYRERTVGLNTKPLEDKKEYTLFSTDENNEFKEILCSSEEPNGTSKQLLKNALGFGDYWQKEKLIFPWLI